MFILAGCAEPPTPTVPDTDLSDFNPDEQLLANVYTPEYYKTILPYVSSETRGLVYSYLPNRYDIDEFEMALMRHSQDYYSADEVYFQEGQYLSRDFVRSLLARQKTEKNLEQLLEKDPDYVDLGLNPAEDEFVTINSVKVSPVYLAYLLEQNYIVIEDDQQQLKGISIGLALNPHQTFINEAKYEDVTKMNEEELIEKGKELAQQVVNSLREQEDLQDVEIMVGLYVLEEQSAVTPGNMVAKTHLPANSSSIKDWVEVNEAYYLLPGGEAQKIDYQTSEQFSNLKNLIKQYYPHYYGIIGIGHYMNDQIVGLDININIKFYSLSEKLSFHQLVSKLIEENFANHYDINVTVRSTNEIYGILHRGGNEQNVTLKLTNWE